MKCGFCAFFCPVYQVERTETSVARGKNYLAKMAIKGEQKFTPEMGEIIGKCLLCKRCVANCPAKTEIDRVVIAARAQMVQEKGLGFPKNFLYRKVFREQEGHEPICKALSEVPVDDAEDRRQGAPSPRLHRGHGEEEFPRDGEDLLERAGEAALQAGKRPGAQDAGRLLLRLCHGRRLSRCRTEVHRFPHQTGRRSGGA